MNPVEIKKGIYWVGAVDWDIRNFHGYLTQRGTSYNAYLIIDKKITLIDTVKAYLGPEMLARISNLIDPAKIDYIVSNHVEMDHSGSLPQVMQICPNAKIICSPQGEKGLKMHYKKDWDFQVVKNGDSLTLGERKLEFITTPMVHWPDNMVCYLPEEKLLFSNDGFGQHIASTERFDDELPLDIVLEEAKKYYANIVLPYGKQVKKEVEATAHWDIQMIAPSHGLIWRSYLNRIIESYLKWIDNTTLDKALVIYDTMWESTKIIAQSIQAAFENQNIPVQMLNLKTTHISDIMTELIDAKYICVGSPTLNNGMLPTVASFLTYMKGLLPQNRTGLAFGSYGWGGQSIGEIQNYLETCGMQQLDPVKVQYIPSSEQLAAIKQSIINQIALKNAPEKINV